MGLTAELFNRNRWDSSDPDRAPPPLPLNPQSPSVGGSPSKPGTSAAIQSAHAALAEKARENSLVPAPLGKNSTHRRIKSSQHGSVRDLGFMIESGRESVNSTPRSHEQLPRPGSPRDPFYDSRPQDDREAPPEVKVLSLSPGPSLTPIIRPIARRSAHSILGENTPPQSATMLALQNLSTPTRERDRDGNSNGNGNGNGNHGNSHSKPPRELRELPQAPATSAPRDHRDNHGPVKEKQPVQPEPVPLSNVTNSAPLTALVRQPPNAALDSLSQQILSLTNIATSLQKEMSQLSRRSRDNATDLLSLKEATNTRDEDIRRSLRDLLTSTNELSSRGLTRDPYGASLLLDSKPHAAGSPMPKVARPFSLPRIPSLNSFSASMDGDRMSTPSLCGPVADGPATISLLEKIVRDMGTKDGQENLISRLSDVADKVAGMATAKKVEELLNLVKSSHEQSAIVPATDASGGGGRGGSVPLRKRSFDEEPSSPVAGFPGPSGGALQRTGERLLADAATRRSSAPTSGGSDAVTGDILNIIRTVKDSVAQGGGLTAEVKALVRELRGEVLGMGREIGRRLEEVQAKKPNQAEAVAQAEMSRVIDEGLQEMKQHMNQLLKEHRRQSATAIASRGPVVDYAEVYNSVRAALKDSQASRPRKDEVTREDVMDAVKEAWETYKPEIEVQTIGLERDEVLQCLQEGLREYAPSKDVAPGATRDEVLAAVAEGLKHFVPPQVETPPALSRDEILDAVRECLEEFEFPVAASAVGAEVTKQDMLDAVKEGLEGLELPTPEPTQSTVSNDEVLERLGEIVEFMRDEFRAVSAEAKQTVAARERETEQVLDATKDGFAKLRADIEAYVDKAAGTNGQEDFLDGLVRTLDDFREEIAELVSKASDNSRKVLTTEIENLRDAVNSSLVPMSAVPSANSGGSNKEIIEALHDGISSLRNEMASRPIAGTNEVLDALQESMQDLRECIERLGNKPIDLTANDEILDALKTGLDGVKSDIKSDINDIRELANPNEKAVATIDHSMSTAMVPIDVLRQDDIKNLERLIAQLQMKMDTMEAPAEASAASVAVAAATAAAAAVPTLTKNDVASKLDLSGAVETLASKEDLSGMTETLASKEDLSGVKEILVSKEDLSGATETLASKDDLAGIVEKLQKLQETVEAAAASDRDSAAADPATREDVVAIETILRNTKGRLDDMVDGEQAVRKDHIDALETVVLETKESLGALKTKLECLDGLSRQEDLKEVESLIAQVANEFEELKERHEKQLDDPERVTKTDVEAVEAICHDVKTAVDQMVKTDLAALPTRDDLQRLETLLAEVRSMAGSEAEKTAKAFEDRQAETVGVGETVNEVKAFLEEFQSTVKSQLEEGIGGVEKVGQLLETLGQTVGKSASVGDELKEMLEAVKVEVEESRVSAVGAKLETDEKLQQTADEVAAKIDEKVGELVSKYNAFQAQLEERAKSGEARDEQMEAAVVGSKAVADELKALIDTLGATVTDSLEKMEEASKTVFGRVEDLVGRVDENHTDDKAEHQQTRDEVKRAVDAVEGLQGRVAEYQPQILESLKDVLLIVGQHYEHSKASTETIREKIEEAKPPELPMLPPPPEKYDDSQVVQKLDHLSEKYNGAVLLEKLEGLTERYNGDVVLEKLEGLSERYNGETLLEKVEALAECYNGDVLLEKLEGLSERYNGDVLLEKIQGVSEQCDGILTVPEKVDGMTEKLEAGILANGEKLDKLADKADQDSTTITEKLDKLSDKTDGDQLVVVDRLDKLSEQADADQLVVVEKLEKLSEQADSDQIVVVDKLEKLSEQAGSGQTAVLAKLDGLADKCEAAALGNGEKLDQLADKVDQDQAAVHGKLDRLVDHSQAADKAFARLETLDKVHQRVIQTAAEVTALVAAQTARMDDDRQAREKSLQETLLALERSAAQKEALEASVAALREEQESLRRSVEAMRAEQDELSRRRTRLTADVASLETAASLRREELREVEDRAQGLERRILEGVMDHSRVLLMAKSGGFAGKGRDAMSRKRVSSQRQGHRESSGSAALEDTGRAATKRSSEHKKQRAVPINMAMQSTPSSRNGLVPPSQPSSSGVARRIVSLSQINNNVAAGGFQRSQSVRQPGGRSAMRKSSWAGSRATTPVPVPPVPAVTAAAAAKGYGDLDADREDKENSAPPRSARGEDDDSVYDDAGNAPTPRHQPHQPALSVTDAGGTSIDGGGGDGHPSGTETLRRSSLGTTVITESSVSGTCDDDDGDAGSDGGGDYHGNRDGNHTTTDDNCSEHDDDLDDTSSQHTENQAGPPDGSDPVPCQT